MARLTTRSRLSSFALGIALGLSTMFILEHNNYMYYLHKCIGPSRTANAVIRKNTSEPKTHVENNLLKPNEAAQRKAKKTRILCWIMTSPAYLSDRAKSVKDTWGKRCDILLFMSTKEDPSFPAIGLNVEEGYKKLWYKTRAAFDYIYQHHLNDAEWFVKADDDTYMVIENLRHILSKLNTSEPHYIGRHFTSFGGYNGGGSGYVFSRETLRRFKKALGEASCPQHHKYEDVAVGVCLRAQGIRPVSTRDSSDKETFIPIPLEVHLTSGGNGTYSKFLKRVNYPRPYKDGPESCSDYPISFHNVKPEMMYRMEYMIYRVKLKLDGGPQN